MIEIDWNPDNRKLKQFGWSALAGFGLIGLLLARMLGCHDGHTTWTWPAIIWALAILCPILGYALPGALRVVYTIMMAITLPIGFVISTALLILLYFVMFTPLAIWFRILKRDELKRQIEPESTSYRIKSPGQRPPASYYRQF